LPQEAGGGVVVLINDITEQKQLEEDSRRRERLSEMGDMAAGVAHEIRNPLNSIAIAAQRLKGEFVPKNDPSDFNQLSQTILDEASRLNQILSRFLELTRSQTKEQQTINLQEPIARAVSALKDEASKSNIEIEYAEHEDVNVKGNSEKLQQVFINLIKNSIQAMPDWGKIRINIDASENEKVKITISDTGPGFPPDALSKVFQPYYTTKSDGSGLGLALAYKTINDFGGTITADNRPDGGARVTIKLPKAKI
jgi:signal transduction histidine kinase